METRFKKKLPQEGTGASGVGESLSGPSGPGCPTYSGGGKILSATTPDDQTRAQRTPTIPKNDNKRRTLRQRLSIDTVDSDDGSDSCHSLVTVSSNPDLTGNFWRDSGLKRSHPDEETLSDSDSSLGSSVSGASPAGSKRGRGRPPTTGEYVGLAKAKEALVVAERLEMEVEAEKAVLASGIKMRTRRELRLADPLAKADDVRLATTLNQQVMDGVDVVLKVATKSKNLKGTCQRELKDAAATIKEAVGELMERTASVETAKLQRDNERLRAELADLRKEVAELRAGLSQVQTRDSPPRMQLEASGLTVPVSRPRQEFPPPRPPDMEEMVRAVMTQVGTMINARLEGLEERLLPAKRLRPPLAGDQRKVTAAPGPKPAAGVTNGKAPQKEKAKKGRQKPKSMAAAEAAVKTRAQREPHAPRESQPVTDTASHEDWATVAKRGKAKKGAGGAKGPGQKKAKPKKAPPKKVKLRPPPTTSAVVLTLQPGAADRGVSYVDVLTEAKNKIDLATLGIKGLSLKQAVTGARMLVVPDDPKNEKAEALARRLRETLNGEDVRVTRPEKCAEVRISGLDDSTTAAEVLAAVARAGDCHMDSLKSGEIRRGRSGLGTIWVRCPVEATKKVVASGRLVVGWASAKVDIIAPKQMRCYRCLNNGHAAATCTSETDRSRRCFRCGEVGHQATQCGATPHCMLCAAAEKPAGHRMWSKACSASSPKKRKAAAKPPGPPKPPAKPLLTAEAMEA